MLPDSLDRWLLASMTVGGSLVVGQLGAWRYQHWINPISAFLSSWGPMLTLTAIGWLELHPIQGWVWAVLFSGMSSFILGAILTGRPLPEDRLPSSLPPSSSLDPDRFRLALALLSGLALAGALGSLSVAVRQVGWRGVILHPSLLRMALSSDQIQDPFNQVTHLNLLVPVLVVVARASGLTLGRGWHLLALLCYATSFLSTGRTKPIWALLWAGSAWLLAGPQQPRHRVVLLTIPLLGLLIFGGMAAWLGKVSIPADLQRVAPELPRDSRYFASTIYYLTCNLPCFQEVLENHGPERSAGAFLLLPLYKAAHLAAGVKPTWHEIGPLLPTPVPANTATFLFHIFLDFGLVGTVILPFLWGAGAGWLLSRPGWARNDPHRLFFGGLVLYVLWSSFIANRLLSSPVWLLAGVGGLVLRFARKSASRA